MLAIKLVSPVCLFLALVLLVCGTALLLTEMPSENVDLHAARTSGDELYEDALTNQLEMRIWARRLLLAALFCAAALLFLVSFLTMGSR